MRAFNVFASAAAVILIVLLTVARPAFAAGALSVGVQLEPPNLDPTSGAAAAIDEIVYANVFEGLTRIREDGTAAPALAERWIVSDDGLRYDFFLREGVTFHDGTPFDAADVIFSLNRARDENSTNAQRVIFEKISAIIAIGPHHIAIELSQPIGAMPIYLGWGDAVIVAEESAATNASNPIGTGPFKFTRWRKGASIALDRFSGYWGEQPPLEQINFIFIPDPTAAFAALMAGDVDGFPNYPAAENLSLIERDERFQIIDGAGEGEMIVAINNGKPPFDDIRVRRALNHAIDKRSIIEAGLFGFGEPIGSHFPPHNPAYVDLADHYNYDPARAKQLLTEAGHADGLDLTLTLPPPAYARRGGEVVAAMLETVGINVTIRNLEWAQWLDQVFTNKNYDLTIVSHTEPLDIDIYARDGYYFQYDSEVFRALIETLSAESDETRRTEFLKAAQRRLADDAVNVFIASSPKVGVWASGVSGVWANAPLQANDLTAAAGAGRKVRNAETGADNIAPLGIVGLFLIFFTGAVAWFGRTNPAYLAARIGSASLTLFAAAIVIFVITELTPGDPAAFMMGLNADAKSLAALRAELGLDKPALERFWSWLGGILHGNFGVSYTYRVPAAELIAERIWISVPLATFAFFLSTAIGIPAGLLAASRRNRKSGKAIMTAAQAGVAAPNFWLAILLVLFFAVGLRWFSAGGFPGWQAGALPALKALLLPAIALAIPQAAILTQIMRSSTINTLNDDYIRTARAKGLAESDVLKNHALRNALIPVLTILGLQFAFLVAGAIIIENVFYLPGLGRLAFQAIAQRDLIVVQGIVMVLVFVVVFASLIVDLAYAIVDPRLRRSGSS
ncbi:MAG: ABC transporter permease subunit [Marinicaulis sp.]|nr:ABC transporter permease subunit [Marinicaulis sp.]